MRGLSQISSAMRSFPGAKLQREETQALLDRAFDGSAELLMASLLGQETLSPETLERLRRMIEEQDV